MIKLKDGSEASDRRLGCLYSPASDQYPVMMLIGEQRKPRSYTWRCKTVLDQGREGSCVGHGCAHELISRPVECAVTHDNAVSIYKAAQQLDPWPGDNYDGTTVDAGAKAVKNAGWIDSYYWAKTLNDLMLGIAYSGPSVIGVNWHRGMFDTDANGYIHATGDVQGGHCVALTGVNLKGRFFWGVNSWGTGWGIDGFFKISFDDMDKLIHTNGVACFFKGRRKV